MPLSTRSSAMGRYVEQDCTVMVLTSHKAITAMTVTMRPEDRDFKKTQKFTWIAHADEHVTVPVCLLIAAVGC